VGKRGRQRERLAAPASEYEHPEHGTLALRGALTPATRAEYASLAPKVREDLWQRQVEFLFERLAVAWTVSDVATTRQKELLARYRAASSEERLWIRGVLRAHLAEWFPDVEAP